MTPVKASGWLNTPLTDEERQVLLRSGIVPVNDVFYRIWFETSPVWLLFGGRGGGKSESVFERQIQKSLTQPYHRLYYGRKVFDTVRGSCFKTIVESIKKLGLERQFRYSESDNSTMIITCIVTGNQMIPFGSDKSDKLKSIKDPTDIVCEELDQFTFLDIQDLFPTLRTLRAICEFWGMFNTKDIYPDHWITRVFFPERADKKMQLPFDVKVTKIFANYYDNYFINHERYKQSLLLAAGGNINLFEALANGAWGVRENDAPWLYAFNQAKHIRKLPFLPDYPVYLSFDFNNDPFACVASQHSDVKGSQSSFKHYLKEFVGEMKVEVMCDKILAAFPQSIFFITGDRSGKNEDLGRNQTLYQIIASRLNCSDRQIHTPESNLSHADSRILCNAMFNSYPNIFISPECTNLISDCEKATIDMKSMVASHLLKDREGYKMDTFDAMRYDLQTYFNKFAKETYFRLHK